MNETSFKFSSYQWFLVSVLAFLQFTIILDLMILAPLGALLMPSLAITPSQFGWVVSVYAFSAGASGLCAAGFADRFDRKSFLLFFYGGFVIGTLCCAFADTYATLLLARTVTGLFGGVIGSVVFAITTDLFRFEKRGRVMGVVQTAFAASQILGIPAGLYLSNHWGWHAPFFMIAGVGAIVGILIWRTLRPINAHLALEGVKRSPFQHLRLTLGNRGYLQAFATVALLSTGGFMLMPFGSAFAVHNLGIPLADLPFIYLTTGLCTIVTGPLVGRAADRYGKFRVFLAGSTLSIVTVLYYTHLATPAGMAQLPMWILLATLGCMFVAVSSRMIPAQALMSAIPSPAMRGSFMSVSSSIQQISGGLASVLAGVIVHESADGKIEHFDRLGYAVIAASLLTVGQMYLIHNRVPEGNGTNPALQNDSIAH